MEEWSVLVAPVSAVIGTLLGVWLGHYFEERRARRQRQERTEDDYQRLRMSLAQEEARAILETIDAVAGFVTSDLLETGGDFSWGDKGPDDQTEFAKLITQRTASINELAGKAVTHCAAISPQLADEFRELVVCAMYIPVDMTARFDRLARGGKVDKTDDEMTRWNDVLVRCGKIRAMVNNHILSVARPPASVQ